MAAEDESKQALAEQLAEAETKYKQAIELRDKDPDAAIELLGQVLEVFNKRYGEKALECADVYLYYGELLFEQAQATTDYLGDQMKSAAMQRAKQMASGDADDAEGDDAAADHSSREAAAEDQEMNPDTAEPPPAAAAEPGSTSAPLSNLVEQTKAASAPAADDGQPDSGTAAPAVAAAGPDADMPQAAAEGDEPDDDQQGSDDGDDDGSESDGEDVGSGEDEAAEAEGQANPDEEQVTGESDDMALAWEMLEMARLIYAANGGAEKYASKLADCHMYIGDILAEQEKFEEGGQEYNTALEMLAKVEGGLSAVKRRAAELEFKRSTALQLMDQPAEALKAIHSAKAHLQARLNELNDKLASNAGSSSTGDAAGAAAFAAFASILSSYKPPEAEAAKDTKQTAEEAAADAALQQEIADLRSVIESMSDRIDELNTAIEAHEDMKETIRKTFAMVSAGQQGSGTAVDGAGSSAAAAAGPVETVGFGPAPVQAGPVQDMGVIGKGKRVAPVPVIAAAAAAPSNAGDADSNRKRPLSDVSNSDKEGAAAAAQETESGKEKGQAAVQPGEVKRVKA